MNRSSTILLIELKEINQYQGFVITSADCSAGRAPAWHAGGQVPTLDSPAPG